MMEILFWLEFCLRSLFEDHSELVLENLALRQQLAILKRQSPRPQLKTSDLLFWVFLSRYWPAWKDALLFVQPQTVIGWHRKGFQFYWRLLSHRKTPGRPKTDKEIRQLIHQMIQANPLWGAPRVHGELLKLGFELSEPTVSRLMPRKPRKPSSQTWRAFLANHSKELVSIDFLVVPTATFRLLYVLVVLSHERRRVIHFNVTAHPTAAWTAQQIIEAFPENTAPRFLLRDRDAIYGRTFRDRVHGMGIEEILTAPQSPWQNAFIERFHGSMRRECLNHVIILNEPPLKRILRSYLEYYHQYRTHLSLQKDAPQQRLVVDGRVILAFFITENPRTRKPVYLDGDIRRTFLRKGGGDYKAQMVDIERMLRDANADRWDSQPFERVSLKEALHPGSLRWYRDRFQLQTADSTLTSRTIHSSTIGVIY